MDNLDFVELPSNVLPTVSGKKAVICMTADGKLYCVTASGAKRLMTADEAFSVDTVLCRADNRSPAEFIGGTWTKIAEGQTIIGASVAHPLNSTGGEEMHTLTIAEMPSHDNHIQNYGGADYYLPKSIMANYAGGWGYEGSPTQNHITMATQSEGGSQPHNNMQPFTAKNYWQRIA